MHQSKLKFRWESLGLTAILILSMFLNFYKLGQEGYGNPYYAAAVKSMMDNWHNLFFNSFDPKGFITIDKPPVGFWIQTISAFIFGFKGWSLFFPQALAGVLSVGLLYNLVFRVFGIGAGILAALFLAVTPIVVATDRTNEVDSMLMFVILMATWAISKSIEGNHLKWLVLAFFLVGVGFNIKMLEAYLVLPAFYIYYAISPKLTWGKKLFHLLIATIVLLVISLSWSITVDAVPSTQRPYIGSTQDNSMVTLAIGYNGINRLVGQQETKQKYPHIELKKVQKLGNWNSPGGFYQNADSNIESLIQMNHDHLSLFNQYKKNNNGHEKSVITRILRLFTTKKLDGQLSWLLPGVFIGIFSLLWSKRFRITLDIKQQTVILWAVWLLTMFVFFSIAKRFSSYYMVMMAPSVAALGGTVFFEMWKQWNASKKNNWFLPIAFVCTVLFEISIVWNYPTLRKSLTILIIALTFLSLICIYLIKKYKKSFKKVISIIGIMIGVLSILVAPIVWAMTPIEYGGDVSYPFAGPELKTQATLAMMKSYPKIENYLKSNYQKNTYLLATFDAKLAAPIILDTGLPVMAIGGFNGSDPVLTVKKLQNLVTNGQVRYFFIENRPNNNQQLTIFNWIRKNCLVVPAYRWKGFPVNKSYVEWGMGNGNSSSMTLYQYMEH